MFHKVKRYSLKFSLLLLAVCGLMVSRSTNVEAAAKQPHIVFVTGDHEYRSEITMPMMAKILEKHHGFKCTVLYAVNRKTGKPDAQEEQNIPGLEVLSQADLAVVFLRWRKLPKKQLDMLLKFAHSGKPMVGLRTTTHSLNYAKENPLSEWNDKFGQQFFGQKWITHHGHDSSTEVNTISEQIYHPILNGVQRFYARSWLYHVEPLVGACEPLLLGTSVNSNKVGKEKEYPLIQPVAWTKNNKGGKVFFTTLGHPQDFEVESMRRLLVNGIYWGLGKEIPRSGTKVDFTEQYNAPESN